MDEAWLSDFLAAHRLPEGFGATVTAVCVPLADLAEAARGRLGRTIVLALCGPQGSGKTTIADAIGDLLEGRGLSVVVLSLDDIYLPKAARAKLAAEVHPLLITRGPPGSHDVALGAEVLDALLSHRTVRLPRFDKADDDRAFAQDCPVVEGAVDVVIFEGWCVGARPQAGEALREPVNELERLEDPDGRWRSFVNTALAAAYPPLFERHDILALLQPPGFEVVAGWRAEQEAKLRARTGRGMSEAEIVRFVAHYERLTRWILEEMPGRADAVFRLDAERRPVMKTP